MDQPLLERGVGRSLSTNRKELPCPASSPLASISRSRFFRSTVSMMVDHIDDLTARIESVESRIVALHKNSEASQRLASAPGVGPITTSAILASVGDGRQISVGTPPRGLAWIDAESPRQGAHRQDQQGRRSLSARTADPWSSSHRRNELPQGCNTTALAEAAARAAIRECCGGRGCSQDGTGALGNDHPGRRLSKDCRSDG